MPAEAKNAEIRYVDHLIVSIDGGEMRRLSPGAQVRDEANRIVQPGVLSYGNRAAYQLDEQGFVHRIWILTPKEAEERASGGAGRR